MQTKNSKEVAKKSTPAKKSATTHPAKKVTRVSLEPSKTTQAIVALAKKVGGTATVVKHAAGTIRVYLDATPVLRITGLSKDEPSVMLRPRLRSNPLVPETAEKLSDKFKAATGLVYKGFFEPNPQNKASFFYAGDGKLLLGKLAIALPKILRANKAS
jgi:hypothetical protein